MSSGNFDNLPIHDVELDTSNPRIRRFLEIYDHTKIGENQIGLALNAPSSDSPSALAVT